MTNQLKTENRDLLFFIKLHVRPYGKQETKNYIVPRQGYEDRHQNKIEKTQLPYQKNIDLNENIFRICNNGLSMSLDQI